MEVARPAPGVMRFGVFELDPVAGELRKAGLRIRLPEQSLKILVLLLERHGRVVTREELRHELWPDGTFVEFDHSLNAAINRLRAALGDSAENPRFVETLAHRGYRFIANIGDSSGAEIQLSPPTATALETEVRKLVPRTVAMTGFSTVLVLALLFALNVGGWRERLLGTRSHTIRSIAVLPLENLSRDSEQEYFADGITDELITELSKMRALKVISRTSVMSYKRRNKSLPEIARELNVDGIVEGSVERSGERVRITAQLIEARTDTHLWGETYERDLRDVMSVQDEVARAVAGQIQIKLTPQEQMHLASVHPINPEAHEEYLKGRYEWDTRTEEGLKKSLVYFQRAITVEPTYALAYSGRADSYSILWANGYLEPNESVPKAKAAALKALLLDDNLSEAHTSLAFLLGSYDWKWADSEREYQRALELNPSDANAHHWYGVELAIMGRRGEGLAEIKMARQLDPLSPRINADVGRLLYYARLYDQAVEELNKAIELDPNNFAAHINLAMVYSQKGMPKEAITELQRVPTPLSAPIALAQAYTMLGERDRVRKIVEELEQRAKQTYVEPWNIGLVYALLGEQQKAFAYLEKGCQQHDVDLFALKVDPKFDTLRSDPRFQDLVRRAGLPQATTGR